MEPCVLIASACESITPHKIVQGILEKDELPEPLGIIEGISSYPWHIDTKYYEADVHICAMNQKTIGNQAFADTVNAVILCFDSLAESKLEPVEQWLAFTKEFEAEIKILVCDSCRSQDFDHSPSHGNNKKTVGVSKLEAQRWCVGNGFELVELNPDESEVDSDVEDDFPESLGIKRVIQALQAHLWPKLRLKDSHRSMLPPQAGRHLQGLVNGLSASLIESDSNIDNSIEIPVNRDDSSSKEKEIKVARVKPMLKSEINNDGDKDKASTTSEQSGQGVQSLTQKVSEPQTQAITSSASTTTSTTTTIKTETVSSSNSSKIREVIAVHPFQIENTSETTSSSKSSQPSSTTPTTSEVSSSSPVTKEQEQKENAPSNLPPKSERIDSMLEAIDSMSDDTFEELFLNLNAMKSKASNLSPTHRKAYAEKMAVAFWKSIGGNDAEVELTSSDEEGA